MSGYATTRELRDLVTNSYARKPHNRPLLMYRFYMKRLINTGRLLQSSLLCIGIVFVAPFTAQHNAPTERSFTLPCEATSFMQSGDGALIWFACEEQSLRKRWESDAAEARKKNLPPPPPPVTSHSSTDVYCLETVSGRVTPLVHANGSVKIVAAPLGSKVVLVLPKESSSGLAVLYDGPRRVAELPIDPSFLVWSADASKIYFYGGSTIQSDAWNILGVLRLNGLAVSREKLVEPTKSVQVCSVSGHIFTGYTIPNKQGELEANTVEYDSDVKFLRRITKFLPGDFSVSCRYVVTEQSANGPLPWEIIEVATGKRLLHFEYTGEGKEEEVVFGSWNPKREDVFLLFADQPLSNQSIEQQRTVQVFSLVKRAVLHSFSDIQRQVGWSKDGQNLVFMRGSSLVFRIVSD